MPSEWLTQLQGGGWSVSPSLPLTWSFCAVAAGAVFWLDLKLFPGEGQRVCPRLCGLLPELGAPDSTGREGGTWVAGVAHLLGGGQAVLGGAQDAADEAELLQGELGRLGALLFLEQAADGQPAAAACGSEEKQQELVRPGLLPGFLTWKQHILRKRKGGRKGWTWPKQIHTQ